jgi:ABC-type lipoprotein release transport system permease subunit
MMLQTLYKLAWRDLGRNRRRSFFSALALGIGVALLLLMASIVEGEMRGALQSTIGLESGHLQVRAPDYDGDKSSLAWKDLLLDPDVIAAQIAAMPEVEVATPRLIASGIVAQGERSVGVRIIGIEPASAANAPVRDGMVEGDWLAADDRSGLLIGWPLAQKLGLAPGSRIALLVNTADGDVDQQDFTVRGIYSTRTPGLDQFSVYMPLAKVQAIGRAERHASSIFVLLHNQDDADAVAARLASTAYRAVTWQEQNALLVQTEQFSRAYMVLLYLIVLGITATVIVNTLVMAVFERTREIGVLSAIGMRSRRIMAMFLAESSLLAAGGIAMGLVLGGLLVAYFTRYGFYIGNMGITGILMSERIYAYLTLEDAVSLSLTALGVTVLASLYPALLAARLEPVAALHSEQ